MNYVERVAEEIRRNLPDDAIPNRDEDALLLLYALLALTKGESVTREDVHNAWSAWMTLQERSHESLVRFTELPDNVRRLDEPYVQAIRAAALTLRP